LDSALQVFWARGYEATSIQDLVDATGLGRASLYGAFGDKRAIFARVLERYQHRVALELATAGVGRSPFAVLEALSARWVDMAYPKAGPRGCMLVLAGTTCTAEDAWVQEALGQATRANEAAFERLFRQAQAAGEVSRQRDPALLARHFIVLQQGVATAARGGIFSKERLHEIVTAALHDWREEAPISPRPSARPSRLPRPSPRRARRPARPS